MSATPEDLKRAKELADRFEAARASFSPAAASPPLSPPVPGEWDPKVKYNSMAEEAAALQKIPKDRLTNEHRIKLARIYGF